jgi:hypothetical protein
MVAWEEREGNFLTRGSAPDIDRFTEGDDTMLSVPVRRGREGIPPLLPEVLAQHQKDYARLLRRYKRLTWAASAAEQRERAARQQPLMELHCAIHPHSSSWHREDDFDMLIRTSMSH